MSDDIIDAMSRMAAQGWPQCARAAEEISALRQQIAELRERVIEECAKFSEDHWAHGRENVVSGMRSLRGK